MVQGILTYTELGEKILDVRDSYYDIPAAAADKLNEMVPEGNPLKGATQFTDDRILSAEERRGKIEENIQTMRDEGNPLRYAYEAAWHRDRPRSRCNASVTVTF